MVTLPKQPLLSVLSGTETDSEVRVSWGLAGNVRRSDGEEFVLPSLSREAPSFVGHVLPEHSLPFLVATGTSKQHWLDWSLGLLQSLCIPEAMSVGLITLSPDGIGRGAVRRDHRWTTVDEVRWFGAGMPCVRRETAALSADDEEADVGRYSRLIGALGARGHARIRELRFVLAGVSRAGSEVATWLARTGIRQFDLIDPDVVERHNADAGEFDPVLDEGQNKAVATARRVRRLLPPGSLVRAIPEDLLSKSSLSAVREADVIITAVDDDAARMVASLVAASYMRVHLDIGTQVTRDDAGRIKAGADVRLVLPDDPPRCLACFGGFAQAEDLRRLGGFVQAERAHWRTRRIGSLRSLNQIAANVGLRALERMVVGDLDRSLWIRYEEGETPSLREIVPQPSIACPLCRPAFGIGDGVLRNWDVRLRRIVRALVGAGE